METPANKKPKSTAFKITFLVVLFTIYSYLVVLVDIYYIAQYVTVKSTVHSLLALVLGGLLVFRTNTAYERWWEGRKHWGQLLNDCRNFAIKVNACVRSSEAEKLLLARKLISFSYGLKDHLRGEANLQRLDGFENSTEQPSHVPAYITGEIYKRLESWRNDGQLGDIELLFLDTHASSLMNICGACERILKTPIAPSWRTFIRQIIGIYLLTLPWGLVEDMSYWTVPISLLVGYFMIGLETIAETVEQPFGYDEDDLKLDEICLSIKTSVMAIANTK